MTFKYQKQLATALVLPAVFALTACGGSSATTNDGNGNGNGNGNGGQDSSSFTTLDAATVSPAAAYMDLASGHSAAANEQWHLSYQKYVGFKTNGGTSGSGSVEACVAKEYPTLFDSEKKPVKAEFEKLTKDSTLADFTAVNKASCSEFETDAIKTQIVTTDWLNADYSSGMPSFSAKTDASNGWIVRSATKDTGIDKYNYARVKVKTLQIVLAGAPVRKAVLSVEKWDHGNASFNAAVDSPELNFSDGSQIFWDMETNAIVTASDDWDMSIKKEGQDYPIQVNGGASGKGAAGVGMVMAAVQGGVTGVTDPTDTAQVYKYFGDSATGAMSKPGSYGALQYNVGGAHKMWPTYSVYLFKDGEKYYKAQVVSNYGADGKAASGNLYIRYAEVID